MVADREAAIRTRSSPDYLEQRIGVQVGFIKAANSWHTRVG